MQNEIPAGTKVKVAVLGKGVMSIRDAEVLAVSDGVVHVQMDGEAVSVDPSQIVPADAPVAVPSAVPPAVGFDDAVIGEIIERSKKDFVPLMEAASEKLNEFLRPVVDRVTALEAWVAAHEAPPVTPFAAPADPAPAPTEKPNEESTAAAASGEPAAGS